jgi:hypothetical protein
VIGKFSTQF